MMAWMGWLVLVMMHWWVVAPREQVDPRGPREPDDLDEPMSEQELARRVRQLIRQTTELERQLVERGKRETEMAVSEACARYGGCADGGTGNFLRDRMSGHDPTRNDKDRGQS